MTEDEHEAYARRAAAEGCHNIHFRRMVERRDDWSNLVERAAIMEYDGGQTRWIAEQYVVESVLRAMSKQGAT
jgi:hypothetical protein